jgi:hypothetical protein
MLILLLRCSAVCRFLVGGQRWRAAGPGEDGPWVAVRWLTVKRALAGRIGESYVPKDWGGERSDLYTSRVFARGHQVSAAWLFKGPGYPRATDVDALGKNGDQIDRLFTEPAELLVLQRCHQIKPSVVGVMDSYAHGARRPCSYMIIDGADIGRILRSLGLFPVTPAHSPLQNRGTGTPRP